MQSFLIHKWDHDQYFHKHEVMLMSFSGRLFTGRRLGRCAPKIPMTSTGFLPYPRLGRSSSLRSSCGQEDAWRSSTWDRYIYIYIIVYFSQSKHLRLYILQWLPLQPRLNWNGMVRVVIREVNGNSLWTTNCRRSVWINTPRPNIWINTPQDKAGAGGVKFPGKINEAIFLHNIYIYI